MSDYAEYDLAKLARQPVVQDAAYINPSTDTSPGGPAQGAVVVLVGTPSTGNVPTYDGTKFVPGTGSGSVDPFAAALQVNDDARIREASLSSALTEEQVVLLSQFYGA